MKKPFLVFFVAIVIPVFILGYYGYNTFAKRREAVRSLLSSSLWVSAEAALRSLEGALLEDESTALQPENFSDLFGAQERGEALERYAFRGTRARGKLFVLDAAFEILVPRTAGGAAASLPLTETALGGPFQTALVRAEGLEFKDRSYTQAADLYRKSGSLAVSPREKAISLEGQGRALILARKYDEAAATYRGLADTFGAEENKAGHPFAVVAGFQLSEIERLSGRDEAAAGMLFDLLQRMRRGAWPLSRPSYEFFVSEIGARLAALRAQGRVPEIQASFEAANRQPSPYLEALAFADLLRREAVPEIRRRVLYPTEMGPSQKGRLAVGAGSEASLVSFCLVPGPDNRGPCLGGFYWDANSLKAHALLPIIETVSRESGLRLRLVDPGGRDVLSGETLAAAAPPADADSVTLPFDRFPFPWKLSASQPARGDLEREVRRENLLYGVFLAVILAFMCLGAVLILRDISREKEMTRHRVEFVNNISHEFKTPLTLIRLYTETLERQEGLSREEKSEAYEIITKEVERLTHMINNVLDFSRIEMGRKEFHFKRGDIAQAVRSTLNSYRYHLEKKDFLIREDIATGLPPMEFDEEAVAGVLINLLSNAMKFSPDKKEVAVRLFAKNGSVVLQVEDRGMGIPAREREKIFEKFYQVKSEVVAEAGGSGLGLPLVKHVAEAHGGEVRVESEPGRGSVFSVVLPVERPPGNGSESP